MNQQFESKVLYLVLLSWKLHHYFLLCQLKKEEKTRLNDDDESMMIYSILKHHSIEPCLGPSDVEMNLRLFSLIYVLTKSRPYTHRQSQMLTCMYRHIPKHYILHLNTYRIPTPTQIWQMLHDMFHLLALESSWWLGFWWEDMEMWVVPHLRFHLQVLFIFRDACHKSPLCMSETPVSLCSPDSQT